jgi:hypothetical protein
VVWIYPDNVEKVTYQDSMHSPPVVRVTHGELPMLFQIEIEGRVQIKPIRLRTVGKVDRMPVDIIIHVLELFDRRVRILPQTQNKPAPKLLSTGFEGKFVVVDNEVLEGESKVAPLRL